jgi:hypothetical protein
MDHHIRISKFTLPETIMLRGYLSGKFFILTHEAPTLIKEGDQVTIIAITSNSKIAFNECKQLTVVNARTIDYEGEVYDYEQAPHWECIPHYL